MTLPRPVLTFPYTALETRDRLRADLAHRDGPYPQGVTVSTKPTAGADENRPRPYVHVLTLGGPILNGVRSRDSVRLNVNAADEGNAYRLAELARALLVALHGYRGDSRPTLTTDPDTGEPLASVDLDAVAAPN